MGKSNGTTRASSKSSPKGLVASNLTGGGLISVDKTNQSPIYKISESASSINDIRNAINEIPVSDYRFLVDLPGERGGRVIIQPHIVSGSKGSYEIWGTGGTKQISFGYTAMNVPKYDKPREIDFSAKTKEEAWIKLKEDLIGRLF